MTAPVLDERTARTILHTLDCDVRNDAGERCNLSQGQIDLKRTAKAALAYWAQAERVIVATNPVTGAHPIRFTVGGMTADQQYLEALVRG